MQTVNFNSPELTVIDRDTGEVIEQSRIMYPKGTMPEPGKARVKTRLHSYVRLMLDNSQPARWESGQYYCFKCRQPAIDDGFKSEGFYKDVFFDCFRCKSRFVIRILNKRTKFR